jgi:hypothetical protein
MFSFLISSLLRVAIHATSYRKAYVCGAFCRKVWPEIEPPINLQSLDFLPGGLHGCLQVVTCVGRDEGRGKACSI